MPFKIFLSSTLKDLVDERQAVEQVLVALGEQFMGMEYFFSREETALETCLTEVTQAQMLILIVGQRYGTTDADGISYTEHEYLRAGELGIPRLVFLQEDESAPESKRDSEPSKQASLKRFRANLQKQHTVSFFKDEKDLKLAVSFTLHREFNQLSARGVIRRPPPPGFFQDLIAGLTPRQDPMNLGEYIDLPVEFAEEANKDAARQLFDSILAVQNLPNKFVLLGEPGSGKTTTLMKLALDAAQKCSHEYSAPFPVFVDLWQWRLEIPFPSFLETILKNVENPSYRALSSLDSLSNLIVQNRICFFLDGLDELGDDQVRLLRDWLDRTEARVVLSCREADFVSIRELNLPTFNIKPLTEEQVSTFAENHLSAADAERFIAQIMGEERGGSDDEGKHLSDLARTPFFLVLMLDHYKRNKTVTTNRWVLLNDITKSLWTRERVQLLLSKYGLGKFARPSELVAFLAEAAFDYVRNDARQRGTIRLDPNLARVLGEASLIALGTDQVRFRHSLFAEYFAANYLLAYDDIEPFVRRSNLEGTFVILAGQGEQKRTQVQEALLNAVIHEKDFKEYSRGPLWALGELGDENALTALIKLHESSVAKELLHPIARIAARLPDQAEEKQSAIDIIKQTLLAEPKFEVTRFLEHDNFSASMNYCFDVWFAVGSIAEIRTKQAAKILMDGLVHFASVTEPWTYHPIKTMTYVGNGGFISSFVRIGAPAVPILTQAIESHDSRVAQVAAEALNRMRYAVPIDSMIHILATHPSAMVRHEVALKLGKLKNPNAIPHLIAALNDLNFWQQGSNNPIMRAMDDWPHYWTVSESAASALAQIGSEECISALKDHFYKEDGSPSIELLLQWLAAGTDLDYQNPFRTQCARRILAEPGGLGEVLPRMGHLRLNPWQTEPIAEALAQRFRRWKECPVRELEIYLAHSKDTESRKWTLVVLGRIGGLNVGNTLVKYLNNAEAPVLQSGAGHGLGILVNRHKIAPDYAIDVAKSLMTVLDRVPPEAYGGIGQGLDYVASTSIQEHPEVTRVIVENLVNRIMVNDDKRIVKNALDALEAVCLGLVSVDDFDKEPIELGNSHLGKLLPGQLVDQVRQILQYSPSLYMKLGNLEKDRAESEDKGDWVRVSKFYQKVLELKSGKQPKWLTSFANADWSDLSCDDGTVYYQLADISWIQTQWENAIDKYHRAIEIFNSVEALSRKSRIALIKCLVRIGNIYFTHDGEPEQAIQKFLRAMEISKSVQDRALFVEAAAWAQTAFQYLGNWNQVLNLGNQVIEAIESDPRRREDKCLILLHVGEAYMQLGREEDALSVFDEVENTARRFGYRNILIESRISRIVLLFKAGETLQAQADIDQTKEIYIVLRDWDRTAHLLTEIADAIYDIDVKKALQLYEEALLYLTRIEVSQVADRKVYLLTRLAAAMEKVERYDEAESLYQQAIALLSDLKMPKQLASILITRGRFLHRRGRTKDGTALVMQAMAIQAGLGLTTSEGEAALAEMNTNPNWKIPSAVVHFMLDTITELLLATPENRNDVLGLLSGQLANARTHGWLAEMEFLSAIRVLVEGRESNLPESNPYIEPFAQLRTVLAELDRLNNIMATTVSVVVREPRRRQAWEKQIASMLTDANLKGNYGRAVMLTGVMAFLQNMSFEEAQKRLEGPAIRVMMSLTKSVEEALRKKS